MSVTDAAVLLALAATITGIALLRRAVDKAGNRIDQAIDEIAQAPLPPALAADHRVHAHVGYRCSYCHRHVTVCVIHVAAILQLLSEPQNCPDCATIADLDRQASTP